MGKFTTYVVLLFGISITLYLLGYTSPFLAFTSNLGTNDSVAQSMLESMLDIFSSPTFLAAVGITAVTSLLLGGGSYSVMYLVPILLVLAAANYFLLPTSYVLQAGLPEQIKILINTTLNLLLGLSIMEFVRGGA